MNTAAIRSLRQKLAQDQSTYGLWVTLEAPSITEMAVALGLDWVVIDAEHGHLDWKEIVEHVRATVRSDTVALVRLAELNVALVKRALDIGADGVVIPWVETAEQLRQAIQRHYMRLYRHQDLICGNQCADCKDTQCRRSIHQGHVVAVRRRL